MLTRGIYMTKVERSVSKQGHLQPRCHAKASPSKNDLEFRRNPAGIPAWTNLEFQVKSRWNPLKSSGIIAGIPPEFQWNSAGILVEIQLEFLKIQDGILLELLPALRWHSTAFCTLFQANFQPESTGILWNYCRHYPGIPVEFHQYFSGIPPAFCTVLQLEFDWNFTRSRHYISTGRLMPGSNGGN